jgi:hypothetical protein
MTNAIHCVFCDSTGVHDCPGGELGSDYFAWRRTAPGETGWTFDSVDHVWIGPGKCLADCYPKPPAALEIAVLSCMEAGQ